MSWGVLGRSWGGLGVSWEGLGGVLGGLGYKGLPDAPPDVPTQPGLEAKMVQVGPKLRPKTFKNPFRRPSQK